MRIKVRMEASERMSFWTFDLEDLNVTQEEWDNLSKDEQQALLQDSLNGLPEQPYWMVDTYTEQE